ncbi:serine/threonine-protein kinase-like protein tel1 [Hyaloscypha variabilis]
MRKDSNVDKLSDKAYHKIFETLFKTVLTEKSSFHTATKTTLSAATTRLTACADAVRVVVEAGVTKFKIKTVEAIAEHIIQTLPNPGSGYYKPLAQHYLQALHILFKHQANVERLKSSIWFDVVHFFIQGINQYVPDDDGGASGLSRSFQGLGRSLLSGSMPRSTTSSGHTQRQHSLTRSNVEDLFQILLLFVSASNAPLPEVYPMVVDSTVRFLRSQGSHASQVDQRAFSTLNAVLQYTRIDHVSQTQMIARDVIPVISRFWQGKAVAKDEMLNSVRDEMLILLFNVYLHLERGIINDDAELLSKVEDLLDILRVDYARRSDRDQLQLEDLEMIDFGAKPCKDTPFRLRAFKLRPHNQKDERNWAHLQVIGMLERLVAFGHRQKTIAVDREEEEEKHPRKRRRVSRPLDHLLDPLRSDDARVRLAALQALPFVLETCHLQCSLLTELLALLHTCAGDKRDHIASWALLAIASCAHQDVASEISIADWTQHWRVGIRSLTFSATSRAAALELHAIVARNLVPYHDIGEDIETIVTSADASGPAVLSDSGLFLMTHLLHARITEVPGASLAASQHVIRWLFARWDPVDKFFADNYAKHAQPHSIMTLLRTCLGLHRVDLSPTSITSCGFVAQAWQHHLDTQDFLRYILLLDNPVAERTECSCLSCPKDDSSSNTIHILNTAHFQSSRKVILELLYPKSNVILESWKNYAVERPYTTSADRFRSTFYSCILMALLMRHFVNFDSMQLTSIETNLIGLCTELMSFLRGGDTGDPKGVSILYDILFQSIHPYVPLCGTPDFQHLSGKEPHILKLFIIIAKVLIDRVAQNDEASVPNDDLMDLDDFSNVRSQTHPESLMSVMPRRYLSLDMWSGSFNLVVRGRLLLIAAVNDNPDMAGYVPSQFIDQFVSLSDEEIISSQRLLQDILVSDVVLDETHATSILERLAGILSSNAYDRCEVALGMCLDGLAGLEKFWSSSGGSGGVDAGSQMYSWFINAALNKGVASPEVLKRMARLLLILMRTSPEYGTDDSDLPSPRSSLFTVLEKGNASVKFYVGSELHKVFKLFILKDHDDVFVDIMGKLPRDSDWLEGIYARLFVFEKLASNWPTLLRRCIYHLFETAGKLPECVEHATRCVKNISLALKVDSPREVFALFAPQMLFTWLAPDEKDKDRKPGDIEKIPFQIFGFSSLQGLLEDAQEEMTALLVMRDQDQYIKELGRLLDVNDAVLLRRSFTKIIAYSVAWDTCSPHTKSSKIYVSGEARVKKMLGISAFGELINLHFADIIALFFNLINHENKVEEYYEKKEPFKYAAKIMREIKRFSCSDVELPPNQQPTFRPKYLGLEIQHLCGRTQHQTSTLYTPPLLTSIARKLLNTVHPALGSLHACSVLRKLRTLISLAGESATQGYPLEMLLQSVGAFLTDPECTDDAIGIIQYLMSQGSVHLLQVPSFVAGITLSILGSLRALLHSTKASTTQESQYKNTKSKAEAFHAWIGQYLERYNSPALNDQLRMHFKTLVQSALQTTVVGNANYDTAESHLLHQLLKDEQMDKSLLSRPSRELALSMLCSNFQGPESFRTDIFGKDDLSIANAAVVWKSCKGLMNRQYLSWAARVLGRAFAASGHIHEELLQESNLSKLKELILAQDDWGDSRGGILSLLQELTLGHDAQVLGLAETALRLIVSTSDDALASLCQRYLSESLAAASIWMPYEVPPSELDPTPQELSLDEHLHADAILSDHWIRDLSIAIAQAVPNDHLLLSLVPILRKVPGFADQAFPFILHLALSVSTQTHHARKREISYAFGAWFENSKIAPKNNLKMLLNAILFLRTQPVPGEKSTAERLRWLDIDYMKAAAAAAECGMFKTALLFVEEVCSQPTRSSRRSSTLNSDQNDIPTSLLLSIFESIDDPDMYYGVQQSANLATILARFEYEKDGPKSLAFHGAQYDSHIRRQNPESNQDVQSLVKALDVLSLSGLSQSLLQAQKTIGMTPASLDSMFRTARKLEQWDIPVPSTSSSNSITVYKTFQAVNNSLDYPTILLAINEGLESTMNTLVKQDLGATALHDSLRTLATLAEIDEVLSSRGSQQFEEILARFQTRAGWMKIGRFDDVNQVLSCRTTTLSTLSQQPRLQQMINVKVLDTRLVEVQSALLASSINRAHNALQESLSLATSMIGLIEPCLEVGVYSEVAIQMETANALWDQGEMASSIGMLQSLDNVLLLKKQTIPVGRSNLLSRIGQQVSVARLEKADRIIERYLKPALKELRGRTRGTDPGEVFHQFAVFCDQQLQDPDSLEDLERLKKLSKDKADEVKSYKRLYRDAATAHDKKKYLDYLTKHETWLKLDEEELQRHNSSRDEFLRQCLENYLLSLAASDDHDGNALRFSALWLEHSEDTLANDAVLKYRKDVPSRKFAPLMNQLASRLQNTSVKFQQLLFDLVLQICTEHPYHGMYQIYAGANSRTNPRDESAVSRKTATVKIAEKLGKQQTTEQIWAAIQSTNKYYVFLAGEKDEQRYKTGRKISLKDSPALGRLQTSFNKYKVPPPTMQIELSAVLDYSNVPHIVRLEPQMTIASGVSLPKIITTLGSNGAKFKQLVKGGADDLRQDAIMEQVFDQVSQLLESNRSTRQRNLSIRTYKVLPLTSTAGVIEFVQNTMPLHEYLMPAHERYYPKDIKGSQCRKEISDAQKTSVENRVRAYRNVTDRFHPVMRYFFTEKFNDPDVWFVKRLAYTRSTAAISILGHVLGLGDRHGHNILLDTESGEVVHIDLGVAFEMGRVLPVPELVPFRLTRDIVDGMGITKTEGVFRRCCEFTLEALRKEAYSIMTILDVLRYDPLYSWSISPVRLAKIQQAQSAAPAATDVGNASERPKEAVNESGEAERALTIVNKKLSKTLSVTATVNDLINQASDERNLAVLYSGWAAYA